MTKIFQTKDSGKREVFATGSQRDTRDGKGRYDLLSPIAIRRLTGVLERGSKKYLPRNWEKGQSLSRYLDSALRHIFEHLEGHRDEDHLAQSLWNLHSYLHTEEMIERGLLPKELDDLPNYFPPNPADIDPEPRVRPARRRRGIRPLRRKQR